MVQKLELLAPAGNLETAKAVISAGADAVYFGGEHFGARAYAGNFKKEEVLSVIDLGHFHNRKMFMTVNTLLKEKELEEQLYEFLLPYYEAGLDAVIVQDFGVMRWIRRNFKDLPIHASTQMTVVGEQGAKFLEEAGAKRLVLARELSFAEIANIHRAVHAELECFVHGALCYCYSGQCLFSSILGGRSGNRGRCAQPCRLPYDVSDANRTLLNGRHQNFPLSPKDLCMIEQIPNMAKSGVSSFKIEGRMKQTAYAGGVVSIYRRYLDRYVNYGEKEYLVSEQDKKKLFDLGNRSGFTEGYGEKRNGPDMIAFSGSGHKKADLHPEPFNSELRMPVHGSFKMRKDLPIEFTAAIGSCMVTARGEIPQTAQKQPLTEEVLRQKLTKTGNTPFVFSKLEIESDPGLFLSVTSLNELRRRTLHDLEEAYLAPFQRTADGQLKHVKTDPENYIVSKEAVFLSASVETEEQADICMQSPLISLVYIDSAAFSRDDILPKMNDLMKKARGNGKQIYYILPSVFRERAVVFYESILHKIQADGFLAKSYEALAFLLKQGIDSRRIRTDHNLYTWSNEARRAFEAYGIEKDTIPVELNKNEIRHRKNSGSEMLIYGYLPLMTSAQCVYGNFSRCNKKNDMQNGMLSLKDRYGVSFPVKRYCMECYNIIYNSRPLCLFSEIDALRSYGIGSFRFSFTIESKEQTLAILNRYEQHLPPEGEYTFGHYKRGVE